MHGPIYHNLPQPGNCYQQERIYQNVTGPPRAVRRTDSSLKRKIARKHSFQNQTGPPVDQAAASAVSELLKSINFPSMSRRENYELVPPQNRQPKQPSRFTTNSLPRNRSEGDLLQRLDPFKLEAVLRFMEANQIDPFTPPEPRGLRRIQSERHLTRSVQPTQSGYYNSMERVPKDKKRKKSFFNWGDDLEYGPGIVEKLKAKFSKLSGLTMRETKRRSPSLDELNNHHDYEPVKTTEQHILRRHSKSSSDMLVEDARSYTIHREIRLEPEEEPVEVPSISTLRRKFEPIDRTRSLSRGRPVSADYSHYQNISVTPSSNMHEPLTRTVYLAPEVEIPPSLISPSSQIVIAGTTSAIIEPSVPIREPTKELLVPQLTSSVSPRETEFKKLRVLEVLNQVEEEPEFVKIGRSLRKSVAPPPDLFETPQEDSPILRRVVENHHEKYEHKTENNNYTEVRLKHEAEPPRVHEQPRQEPPKVPSQRKFVIRGEAHIPTLSNNYRIKREFPTENFSPPDPEPMRRSSIDHRPSSPIQTTLPVGAPHGSPPPEEPRPSKILTEVFKEEEPCRLCEETKSMESISQKETVVYKEKEGKSEDGFNEVQRMLSKFQISRNSRGVAEAPQQPEIYSPPPIIQDNRSFSATVVGVHNSARQATTTGRVNVVSISVRSDAPSIISTSKNSSDVSPIPTVSTATKRPAPSPPEFTPTPQPQPLIQPPLPITPQPQVQEERRSLTTKYFEDKARREKPYGDDVTELRTELRESSVDDLDELEDTLVPNVEPSVQDSDDSSTEDDYYNSIRPSMLRIPEPMIAGDGNLVRHTLLSLVMEEDIPQLLEAMNERDLQNTPSTSSIIHPLETRKQRRQQRQVSSIKFQEENPAVYTYLEESAQISEQWKEGAYLDYNEYQQICEESLREKEQGIIELERWKAEVARRMTTENDNHPTTSVFNSIPDPSTICPRAPAVA